jgi:hypothetical protein
MHTDHGMGRGRRFGPARRVMPEPCGETRHAATAVLGQSTCYGTGWQRLHTHLPLRCLPARRILPGIGINSIPGSEPTVQASLCHLRATLARCSMGSRSTSCAPKDEHWARDVAPCVLILLGLCPVERVRCHITWVCGKPCNSSNGRPFPLRRMQIVVSPTSTTADTDPLNIPASIRPEAATRANL